MTKPRWICGTVLLAGLATACGSNGANADASAAADRQRAAAATRAQPPQKNACALVPRAEVEAIAKQKLDLMHDIQADDQTNCELNSTTDNTLLVQVTVYWRGGKEMARTNQAAMSMAKQMMNDDEVDIEELTGSGKARGIADKAFYSDVMPSWFLKGDVLVEVISPRFGHEQTKGIFLAIAREAASKL